jgi:hypothetical protein
MIWRAYLCDAPATTSTECGVSRTAHHHLRGHRFTDLSEPRRTIVTELAEAWRRRSTPWGRKNPYAATLHLEAIRRIWHAAKDAA